MIDLDGKGQIVGIDIQHASQILDLATLGTQVPKPTLGHPPRVCRGSKYRKSRTAADRCQHAESRSHPGPPAATRAR
jgi:hypothetical protein